MNRFIKIPLYEKAVFIAARLEEIIRGLELRPEKILERATPDEIDFFYERLR